MDKVYSDFVEYLQNIVMQQQSLATKALESGDIKDAKEAVKIASTIQGVQIEFNKIVRAYAEEKGLIK